MKSCSCNGTIDVLLFRPYTLIVYKSNDLNDHKQKCDVISHISYNLLNADILNLYFNFRIISLLQIRNTLVKLKLIMVESYFNIKTWNTSMITRGMMLSIPLNRTVSGSNYWLHRIPSLNHATFMFL